MQNNELQQKQALEAQKRMGMLKIMGQVKKDLKTSKKRYYSENQGRIFNAVLYWVDNKPEYAKLIDEFEKEHDAFVYHAQLTHTYDGDLFSLLYVSKNEEEWERDRNDIANGEVFAYVANLNDELCSDYGYIGIKPSMGGVTRTY